MILLRLLTQTVFLAIGQIWANKLRALLTALGIIIGVASVIAVIGSLTGLRGFVLSEVETFGARKMWIWGHVPRDKRATMRWSEAMISEYEARELLEHAEAIDKLTVITRTRYDCVHRGKSQKGMRVSGIWPEWHEIEDRSVERGRQFIRSDEEERQHVCLVNDKAIEELELGSNPLGKFILIRGHRFLVVGVVETKEVSMMFGGGDAQGELFIPFSTARMLDPYDWMDVTAQLRAPELADEAKAEVRFILRKLRQLDPEEEDTFQMEVLQSAIEQFNRIAGFITAIALVVVSISLLVGGIGIMNIMLVSVSERTREIGLRKAVGARPSIILMQFLVEAVVLCSMGGGIGLLLGQALTQGMRRIPNFPLEHASVPAWAIVLAFAFSGSVGIVFGMFPALKAARLDPIDALRHE